MREIKFRAWDLLNNCWLLPKDNYPVQILGTQQTSKSEFVDTGNVFRLSYKVEKKHGFGIEENDAIICMFTGLLDKNGTEIYEGDIVKYTRKNWYCSSHPENNTDLINLCEIYYSEEHRAFREKGNFEKGDGWNGYLTFNDDRAEKNIIEVIGNIYENPELLNNN